MSDLLESLKQIEIGVSELACAHRTLERIEESLVNADTLEEAAPYMDSLHIVTGFLDGIVTKLDTAVSAANLTMSTKKG